MGGRVNGDGMVCEGHETGCWTKQRSLGWASSPTGQLDFRVVAGNFASGSGRWLHAKSEVTFDI